MKRILIVIMILLLSGCSNGGLFSKDPDFEMDVAQFTGAFYEDLEEAELTYLEKYVQLTGVVNYISTTKDEAKMQLFGGAVCSFTRDLDSIDHIKMYSKVIVNGTVEGVEKSSGKVLLNKCKYVDEIKEPEIVTTAMELSTLVPDDTKDRIVKITGTLEYMDEFWFQGWSLKTDREDANLPFELAANVDASQLYDGDEITITGTIVEFRDYVTYSLYRMYNCDISQKDE